MPFMPQIDKDKCDNCGLCVSVCTCGALVYIEETVTVIETQACDWCMMCEAVCPLGAITCPFEIVLDEVTRP